MLLRYATIGQSLVDGPGARSVIWFQGCPIHCPGCQNPRLQDGLGGRWGDSLFLAMRLLIPNLPVTLTGGEPFAQPGALLHLLRCLKMLRPDVHVAVYSGFTWEDLLSMAEAIPDISDALLYVDVLVDGPYVAALDHDGMQWRGSSNQRAIAVQATLANWSDADPVLYDWDTPALTLTAAGDLLASAALAAEFQDLGSIADARRCGQPVPA
ncbi:MAG: 4Fe-4S single cluster domain-containing protein [Armatimonadia bacterium]